MLINRNNKVKTYRKNIDKPLWNKRGVINRDIGFELMFGFYDKSDPNLYNEGLGIEEMYTPKQPNPLTHE